MQHFRSWFDGWRKGRGQGFEAYTDYLWNSAYPALFLQARRAYGFGDARARDVVDQAFWRALEEVDVRVSGGVFLFEADVRGNLVRRVTGGVYRGSREPLEWTAPEAFHAFARRCWRLRVRDAARMCGRRTELLAEEDPVEQQREPMGERAASPDPGPEPYTLSAETVNATLVRLETAAENPRLRDARRRVTLLTVLYIKYQIARASVGAGKDRLPPIAEATTEHLAVAAALPVEELLRRADPRRIDFDAAEWGRFLRKEMPDCDHIPTLQSRLRDTFVVFDALPGQGARRAEGAWR